MDQSQPQPTNNLITLTAARDEALRQLEEERLLTRKLTADLKEAEVALETEKVRRLAELEQLAKAFGAEKRAMLDQIKVATPDTSDAAGKEQQKAIAMLESALLKALDTSAEQAKRHTQEVNILKDLLSSTIDRLILAIKG